VQISDPYRVQESNDFEETAKVLKSECSSHLGHRLKRAEHRKHKKM